MGRIVCWATNAFTKSTGTASAGLHCAQRRDRLAARVNPSVEGNPMSTRDSEHQRASRSPEEQVDDAPVVADSVTEHKEALDADVDSILDEIDEVLEENAEDFVKGFVQKGGQ